MDAQVVFPIKKGQKWGLIDEKGTTFLPPTYDAIGKIDKFGYAVIQLSANVGLINKTGKVIFQPQFQDIYVVGEGLFAVKQHDVWKIIDETQKTILKEKYSDLELLENGAYLRFLWQGKYGIVTRKGKLISTAQYENITPSPVGTFYIKKDGKFGIINTDGQIVLHPRFDRVVYGEQAFIFVFNNKKWGIYNPNAVNVVPIEWDEWSKLSDNLIRLNNKKGGAALLSLATEQIISEGKYDNFLLYANANAVIIRKGGKIGLMNMNGEELLACRYSEIQPFSNGLYRVKNMHRWGIVGQKNEVILPTEYSFIAPLKGSVCGIKRGETFAVMNIKGEIVTPFMYDRVSTEENRAKSYQGTTLTIYDFDDEGGLIDKNVYEGVKPIKVGKDMRRRRRASIGIQGFQIGNFEWYYDSMQDRWGLRNIETGKDKIKPSYDMISIQRDLGITIVGLESQSKIDIDRTEFRFEFIYGIVNNERGLQVAESNLWDIRLGDFKDKNLPTARIIFNDGSHGLMAKNGKILQKDFLYIGEFEDGLTRISIKGNWGLSLEKSTNNLGKIKEYLESMRSPNALSSVTNFDQKLFEQGLLIAKNALWGYMDTLGQIKIQPQFEFGREFKNGVAVTQLNGHWGLIDLEGKAVLDCKYNDVKYLENSNDQMIEVLVRKERIGLIDSLGNVIVPAIYNEIGEPKEGRIAVKRGTKWGFCDLEGNEIIPCIYDKIQDFSEGLAAFKKERRWGFMDKNGDIVIKNQYKRAGNFKENLAPIITKYDYQYIDKTGKIIIKTTFDEACDFENGVARVRQENEWGLIDLNGNYIYKPAKYFKMKPFDSNGLSVVQMGNNDRYYAIINQKGEKLTKGKYDKILPYSNGLAVVKDKNGYGFINTLGEEVIKTQFTNVKPFSENIAAVQQGGKWGYINPLGEFILSPTYSKALSFCDGFGIVYEGYKNSGLVTATGEFSIKPEVDRILAFSEGKGLTRTSNYSYAFVTETNKLSKGYFQEALPFQYGVAIIKNGGLWGLLTHQGVEIVPPKYDEIKPFVNGYAQVKIKRFYGVTDLTGKVIVEPNYEYITYWGNGIFRVENGDRMGYFNIDGNWIWAME